MTADLEIDISVGPVRGIPVLATAVDVVILNGPAILKGWSLRDTSGDIPADAEGTVTSPAALQAIATTITLPAGTYEVNWTVELSGTLGAGDANNFEIGAQGFVKAVSVNPAVAGSYPQPPLEIVLTASATVVVKAIAIGTVGAVYTAAISLTPTVRSSTVVELQDGNQPLGEIALPPSGSDTETMPGNGLLVGQQINVHVVSGAVAGVVYAQFDQ